MKYIFTNFGSGTGPYVRTIDMGLELIKIFKQKINENFSILVPWVYGERQRRIIIEEFGHFIEKNPNLILLDEYLGQQFKKVLFDGRNYNIVMRDLISCYDNVEKNIQNYLKKEFSAQNVLGDIVKVDGKNVILEVSRNANVSTNIKFSYYTSIGYFEKIIRKSLNNPNIKLDKILLKKTLSIAKKIESYQQIYFQPEPNCFSYEEGKELFKEKEIKCPPLFHPPQENNRDIEEGFYVLVSGISYHEKIYYYAKNFGYKIYTNQILKDFDEAQRELPRIVTNKNIKFVFARPAWNTIWLSNISKKPLIFIDYIQGDFPEIYFNVLSINKHKFGIIFQEDLDIKNILIQSKSQLSEIEKYYNKIKQKYGTLDGIKYSCGIIADDFLKKYDFN